MGVGVFVDPCWVSLNTHTESFSILGNFYLTSNPCTIFQQIHVQFFNKSMYNFSTNPCKIFQQIHVQFSHPPLLPGQGWVGGKGEVEVAGWRRRRERWRGQGWRWLRSRLGRGRTTKVVRPQQGSRCVTGPWVLTFHKRHPKTVFLVFVFFTFCLFVILFKWLMKGSKSGKSIFVSKF